MTTIKTSVTETTLGPKDIFTKGNLVIFQRNRNYKFIILVDKSIDDKNFSGQVINHGNVDSSNMGTYHTDWEKAAFTQFYGTITIESTL